MQKAKDNGITFVTIPPHTSHKLQPVDVSVYYPFEEYFAQAMDDWMRSNPGEMVRINHISQFVKHAMIHSMTPNNILAGFQKTGIFPLNTEIFQDADFEVAEMTHRPDPTGGPCTPSPQPRTSLVIATSHTNATPSTSSGIQNHEDRYVSPSMLFPAPKAQPRKSTSAGRKRGKKMVLTDKPVKQAREKATRKRMLPKVKSAKHKKNTLWSHHRTQKLTLRLHL